MPSSIKCLGLVTFFACMSPAWAHTEGVVADLTRPALLDCSTLQLPKDQRFQDRVSSIFNALYKANREQLGPALADRTKLCVQAGTHWEPNASAYIEHGLIVVTRGFLEKNPTDEALAAVLSHELGHIAMYHVDPIPFELRATQAPETVAMLRRLVSLSDELFEVRSNREVFTTLGINKLRIAAAGNKALLELLAEYDRVMAIDINDSNWKFHPSVTSDELFGKLIRAGEAAGLDFKRANTLHLKAMGLLIEESELEVKLKAILGSRYSKKILSNFREREADEVGLEIYVRSGYDMNRFEDGRLSMLAFAERMASKEVARAYCEEQLRLGQVVEGDESHPSPCFRLFNIRNEIKKHGVYYSGLQSKK